MDEFKDNISESTDVDPRGHDVRHDSGYLRSRSTSGGRRSRSRTKSRTGLDDVENPSEAARLRQYKIIRRELRRQKALIKMATNFSIAGAIFSVFSGVAIASILQVKHATLPFRMMMAFARIEKENLPDYSNITSVQGMDAKSYGSCPQANSFTALHDLLRSHLYDIPQVVREDIVNSVAIDKLSFSGSVTHTEQIERDKFFLYVAFWSAAYNGKRSIPLFAPRYTACVSVAGVPLNGSDIRGWERSSVPQIVGRKSCGEGLFAREFCALYRHKVTKYPVFKSDKPENDERANLHKWMVKMAVERGKYEVKGRHASAVRTPLEKLEYEHLPLLSQLRRNNSISDASRIILDIVRENTRKR